MLELMKKHWSVLAQASVLVGTCIASFLTSPPVTSAELSPDTTLPAFMRWLIAVLAGFAMLAAQLRHGPAFRRMWIRITAVAALLTVASFATYFQLQDDWSVVYARKQRIIIGTQLTPAALARVKVVGHQPGDAVLLEWFTGNSPEVWSESEIRSRARKLGLLFCAVWLAAAITMIALVNALGSAGQARRKPAAAARA